MKQDLLPSERDFDPYGGNLDAQCAWKHFGGLTLEQAFAKFIENPEGYQEDFMFMGGKAFRFYFPVIEDYVKSAPREFNGDDHQAWIIAHCIKLQFEVRDLSHLRHLVPRVYALADYVRGNIERFSCDEGERNRVANAWTELVRYIGTIEGTTS